MKLAAIAASLLASGRGAQVVRIAATRGSAPRDAGTCMLVMADASHGSIGGGHLEWEAIAVARQRLAAASAPPEQRQYALGASLGQCCGGAVTLAFSTLDAAQAAALAADEPEIFRLWLFGAGHVGRALVQVLSSLSCSIEWVDERADAFPAAVPDQVCCRASEEPAREVADARGGDYYLVMTHSHALDERIVEAILTRGDAGFVGLIGSATKRRRLRARLQARGLDAAPVVCPIGLPGLTGKEPGVIAISAAAQLVQHAAAARRRLQAEFDPEKAA
jgi:xanthine dehydrogenase accessory factor